MPILVFKTNLRSKKKVSALATYLHNMDGIVQWNVDLHDIDKILRVECNGASAAAISMRVQQAGYYCEELQG